MTSASHRRHPTALRRAALAVLLSVAANSAVFGAETPAPAAPATPAAKVEAPAPVLGVTAGGLADLGHGLSYVRIDTLPIQLEAATAALKHLPLVLDLRRSTSTPAATEQLRDALTAAAKDASGAIFVLLSPETEPGLRAALPDSSRVVTLGAKAGNNPVKVALELTADADHAAYEAILAGRPLTELIEEKVTKRRFDEARLAKEHAENGGRDNLDSSPNDVAPDAELPAAVPERPAADKTAATAPAAPPAPKDLVLQRAVFLHRALLALNRLPGHSS